MTERREPPSMELLLQTAEDFVKEYKMAAGITTAMTTIIDILPVAVSYAELPSMELVYWNQQAVLLTGLPKLISPAKDWTKVYRITKLDKVTPYPVDELPLTRGLKGETVYDVRLFVDNPERGHVLLSCDSHPIYSHGEQIGACCFFREIPQEPSK